jgi:hypothetical protein
MDLYYRNLIWQQLGASIDALAKAIEVCPTGLWEDRSRNPEYWYLAYHTIFWLDLYLEDFPDNYHPPAPYGLEELDPAGLLPPTVYTQEQMLSFLAHGRARARRVLGSLTEQQGRAPYRFGNVDLTVTEKFLYTMRHVQHHTAQMHLILRQTIDSAPRWVFKAKDPITDN